MADQIVDILKAVQRPQVARLQAEVERLRTALRQVACRTVMFQDGVYLECSVCGGASQTVRYADEDTLAELGIDHRPDCLAYPQE